MKFFVINQFLYRTTFMMLANRFANCRMYDDYCLIMEPEALLHIDKLSQNGFKIIYYDLEHTDKAYYKAGADRTIRYDGNLTGYIKIADQLKQLYEDGSIAEIWTYTIENKKHYKSVGMDYVKYCPYLFTETALNFPKVQDDKLIDVLFYGDLTEYRINNIIRPLHDIGIGLVVAHAFTGAKLDSLIANSKIVLDCRRTCSPEFNQNIVRQFYPVINSTCVLAQTSRNDNYMGDSVVYFNDTKSLIEQCSILLGGKWIDIANEARSKYKKLCESGDVWHTSDIVI